MPHSTSDGPTKTSRHATPEEGAPRVSGRGGARPGAGRKPTGDRAGVPHRARSEFAARFPRHVIVRLLAGLPRLRNRSVHTILRRCFLLGNARFGFRLVHYSIQSDHLHFITEADDAAGLARGMQGLLIRIAKALNKHWGRKGSMFADRFEDRVLTGPREVRNALCHVLHNARHHGLAVADGFDPYCSGWWFDGWREPISTANAPTRPTAEPQTSLLRTGWRRCRLLGLDEVPG